MIHFQNSVETPAGSVKQRHVTLDGKDYRAVFCDTIEEAKAYSASFMVCFAESNDAWCYFYRGEKVTPINVFMA